MKENMAIAQLRGTIFVPFNIGYNQDNYNTFSKLLLPDSKVYNANPPEAVIPGTNPNSPQYGMSWRLFKRCDREGEYNIIFLPGKIDIILTKDVNYGGDTEKDFCNKCIDWFTKILDTQGQTAVSRIAYAPLYAIRLNGALSDTIWSRWLKNTIIDGTPMQDINLGFLLKRKLQFNDREIQMNLLYNISDGVQIQEFQNNQTVQKVVLLQLDINSIPEIPLALDQKGVVDFFNGILEVKNNLVDYVAE